MSEKTKEGNWRSMRHSDGYSVFTPACSSMRTSPTIRRAPSKMFFSLRIPRANSSVRFNIWKRYVSCRTPSPTCDPFDRQSWE
eukprot:404066-Pleurochrysis_carterae.AAC.1